MKGESRTGEDRYWYPLTIADQHTRFLLTCRGVLSTQTVTARPMVERTVREYDLPVAIRTDNGVPFATQAIPGQCWGATSVQLTFASAADTQ